MIEPRCGGMLRNIPNQWCRWKHMPDAGTLVHILANGHFAHDGEFKPLPGGFFAEVNEQGFALTEGNLNIMTVPATIVSMPEFGEMPMLECPVHLRGSAWDEHGCRLEVVPDDVQDAVRAYIALQLSNGAEALPLIVEDGWLC
jgi:hypothetical protein